MFVASYEFGSAIYDSCLHKHSNKSFPDLLRMFLGRFMTFMAMLVYVI